MAAVPGDTVVDTSSAFDRALSTIEGELAVVFANAGRVAAACEDLRAAAGSWTDPGHVERVAGLLPLVHKRTGPFLAPVLVLLREAALAAAHPWPLLLGLLASRDEALCARTLEDAAALAASGTLVLDLARVQALAALGEREGSPLLGDACVQILAVVLRHWQPADARDRADPVRALLLDPDQAAVRRLAARVLDLTGKLPDAEVIGAVLAPADATTLSPALAYTRATHLDLVELVSEPGAPAPIAAALCLACAHCGETVVNDLVGEFGWRRVNLGLTVRPCVGVSVDGSLPFLLTPAEARLVDTLPGARRVFDQVLAVGHGGTVEAASGGAVRDETVDRFRALNLAHAEVLGDILDIEPLTVARVETILRKMDTIVAEFASLFGARSEECAVLPGLYEGLTARIRREMDGAPPGRPLSMELTRLVQMFEDPPRLEAVQTLHGLKRYLHQRGLALGFGLLEASQGTNRTVDLAVVSAGRVAGAVRRIEYVDVDPEPARAGEPSAIPYAVAVVVEAFARHLLHGETTLPRVRIYCYGNEVHYFVSFRNHPVFVRIDYSPPLGGGMIDLAYYGVSKYELDAHPGIGLEAIQAIFRRLDFQVEVDTTRIHARYDKERALDLADLCEKAETLFRLVPYLMDVDWLVGGLDLRTEARRAVAAAWADFFARWGVLPNRQVLTRDGRGLLRAREPRPEGVLEILWQGEEPYEDVLSGRPRRDWLAEAHAALARQGLEVPFVEQEREAGQIPLEHYLLRPLRAAVSRGALVEAADGFRPAAPDRYRELHEADRFAMLLGAGDDEIARAARMARLATALERSLRFRTTGRVNGHEVQRARLALRDTAGALYVLRDGAGIFRLAIFAPGGALYLHRDNPAAPWRDTASSDVEALAALLRRNNFLPSWIDVPASHAGEDARHVREIFAVPDPGGARRTLPGERVVPGAKAAPGRGVGLARLGTRGRQAADLEGGVLFAATLHPEDSVFLPHATAVVGTGGGILSHAGLMAVQFGRPALVVDGTWRDAPGEAGVLACRRTEFEEVERQVAGCLVTERRDLRECEEQIRDGDLVVVDADRGVLEVLGQSGPALAMHDGLRTLEEANRRLALATAPLDVLAQRGHRLRARHQLERVLARVAEPALVRYAVTQLLSGAPTGASGGDLTDQVFLLGVLRQNPASGPLSEECTAALARDIRGRYEAAHEEALRVIPGAEHAYDLLALRRAVARLHDALRQVQAGQGAARGDVAPPDEVEALAVARLSMLFGQVVARLRRPRHRAALQAVTGDPAPAAGGRGLASAEAVEGVGAGDRHLIRQAERIAALVPVTAEARETIADAARALAEHDAAVVAGLADRLVLWPEDGGLEIEPLAGSKAANLAELARLGEPHLVPPWFVVTDRAFRVALATPPPPRPGGPWTAGPAPQTLGDAIDGVVVREDADPAQKAALIAQLWAEVRLPADLEAQVSGAYARLAAHADAQRPDHADLGRTQGSRILDVGRRTPAPAAAAGPAADLAGAPYVAIRSSAREEDTETAVRAGEFDTFLFVRGSDALLAHLRRAWSGLWTERDIHDRAAGGRAGLGEGGGVIVQCIAWSRVSGVLQTTNLAGGRTREMVINVGLGLGEGVVSGRVAADHVTVSKDEDPETEPLAFRYLTADKRERVVFDTGAGSGTVRADVLSHQRLRPALEYAELVELVAAAKRLESAYGYPLDIEFGFEGTALRLLQVRPVPGSLAVWSDATDRRRTATAGAAGGPSGGE